MSPITIDRSFVKKSLPKRKEWSKKGDFGKLLVVGGNSCFSGAPGFVAIAALCSGCDISFVAAPKRAADIVAGFSPDLITKTLSGDFLTVKHTKKLTKISEKFSASVIGNGLGQETETLRAVKGFIEKTTLPLVVDADGLKALKNHTKTLRKDIILTPHSGEFSHIFGKILPTDLYTRSQSAMDSARKLSCTILLKGHVDIITNGERIAYSRTGNPYMTKGGTGDILAGLCAGFLAQGVDSFSAACSAAYICGLAGDLTLKKIGPAMLASDILGNLSKTIKKL